ncbi:L,D-transpeptidase family protein [Candidatus Paracaedibacter symbiosus]|uniref:L,D-transpeptidase family protein n=1 Tax=Candidatus Paracaedibacter symbiosus TaxID=244582 RepID=UPI00068D8070|nr:L,D-transpeptidase family protein [Candidatus Paracaedibacter symbiosus]
MTVYHGDNPLKTYKIALGFSPEGHKRQVGDGKTPEGTYRIEFKNKNSQFHRSLKISYPSLTDARSAKQRGVRPGNDIMIHGLGKGFAFLGKIHFLKDWTRGCIAVTNQEIEEIYASTQPGTTVKIVP